MKKIISICLVMIISISFVTSASAYSYTNSNATPIVNSKKGIQGHEVLDRQDGLSWGVRHVLLNLHLDEIAAKGSFPYTYEGQTYYFNDNKLGGYIQTVRDLNRRGITPHLVLLLRWEDSCMGMMVNGNKVNTPFYGLNTDNPRARALLNYIVENLSTNDCHVDYWILGNEVNMPNHYNYTGTLDPAFNAKKYAEGIRNLYNIVDKYNKQVPTKPTAQVCVSVERSWNHNDGGGGIATRDFLNRFNSEINKLQGNIPWAIAYHAYAAIMDPTVPGFSAAEKSLWRNDNPLTPDNENAAFVTAKNLNVLTDYVTKNFGSNHRIVLSEQGFDAKGGEDYQAASIAYTYYKAQFNPMIDAVIFRALEDDDNDGGLKLGIAGRKAENVFKYMDTDKFSVETYDSLRTIGVKNWNFVISGFTMPGMPYADVGPDAWYLDYVCYMYDNGVMTGLEPSRFGASGDLSRAQFATVLYRLNTSPTVSYTNTFPDVPNGYFFTSPVLWANNTGVVSGYENGLFGPSDNITREQIVLMMYRYAAYKGYDLSGRDTLNGFPDKNKVSSFSYEAMQWGVANEIISGDNGKINPQGYASRATCATIMMRFMEKYK